MNIRYKLVALASLLVVSVLYGDGVFAGKCGNINGVSLPCYRTLLSGNEGDESLPYYPFAKRENGCSIPPAKPGANDTISLASININFTDICNKHDRCYYTLGTDPTFNCNIPFENEMRAKCEKEVSNHAFTVADLVSLGGTRAAALSTCYAKATLMGKATIGTQITYHTEAQKNQKEYLKEIERYRKVPFWWSYAGPVAGKHCVKINEPSNGDDGHNHTWGDNYLCSDKDRGIKWSYAGKINGMVCTNLHEPSSSHTWGDNYICVPKSSGIKFTWSSAGADYKKGCIRINEPSDPHTWNDNYLCY